MHCLQCDHWAKDARKTTKGERWCKHLNTWTSPGFACDAYDELLMRDTPGEWYTIAEVSEMCHVSNEAVRYWIQTGRLKAYPAPDGKLKLAGQFNTVWHIDKAIADRYVEWYLSVVDR